MVMHHEMQFFLKGKRNVELLLKMGKSVNRIIEHTCSSSSACVIRSWWERCYHIGIESPPLALALNYGQVGLLEPSVFHLIYLLTEFLCLW